MCVCVCVCVCVCMHVYIERGGAHLSLYKICFLVVGVQHPFTPPHHLQSLTYCNTIARRPKWMVLDGEVRTKDYVLPEFSSTIDRTANSVWR